MKSPVQVDCLCVKPTRNGCESIDHHGKVNDDMILDPTIISRAEEWAFYRKLLTIHICMDLHFLVLNLSN